MPNQARSSFEIILNGTEYSLRPTFEAIMQFEEASGCDVFEGLNEFAQGKIRAKIIAGAIWAGIKGEALLQKESAPSFNFIGNECQSHGMEECSSFAIEFLSRAVASDSRLKKLVGEIEPQKK